MSTYQLDAVAAGRVKLQDITSSEQNRVILGRIKDNDPSLTSIRISWTTNDRRNPNSFIPREGDDLTWLGRFIGLNTTLTEVCFHHITGGRELSSFFIGLSRNKTIRTIQFWGDIHILHDCEALSAMNMPHIRKIFSTSNLGESSAHNFALGLCNCKSLKEYCGIATPEILAVLSVLPTVESINCYFTSIGNDVGGWVSLDHLLKHTKKMTRLALTGVGLGNRGLTWLALGLTDNNSLKNCNLCVNNIGDKGVEALAKALLYNRSVQTLNLDDNNIGDIGAISLAKSLGQCSLCELSLNGNSAIADHGIAAIAGELQSQKCMIKFIGLGGINIGSVGMLLRRAISNSMVTSIDFCPLLDRVDEGVGMDDDKLGTVMEGLTYSSTLRELNISGNDALTAAGLRRHLHPYLSSKYCTLKTLDVSFINIGDEGALVFAYALVHNKSLSKLCFDTWSITDVGWNALSTALCDSTSANSIYLSNHSLREMPSSYWLYVNKIKNRSMVIKFKILRSNPDLDMTPFLRWNVKFLPLIKSWFVSMSFSTDMTPSQISSDWEELESTIDNRELSAIFMFVRAMPSSVASEYKTYFAEQLQIIQVMGSRLID